jgi:PD-(D/E)XK nuclease superfamily
MSDASKALASITPKKREQLHISGINMLSECGLRFYFRYVLGIRRPPSAYMHIGTAVDESIARDLGNKIEHGVLLPRSDTLGIAEATFDVRQAKEPIELEPDDKKEGRSLEIVLGEAKDKTVALAGLHYDEAAPKIQPSHVQRKFSINMDSWMRKRAKQMHEDADKENDPYRAKLLHSEAAALNASARIGVDLAGEQDVVEQYFNTIPESEEHQLLTIRDTKTSGKSPVATIADDSDQLTIYSLASLVLDKKLPDSLVLDYLIYTPKRHDTKYVPVTTTRTMEDLNVALYRFSNAIHAYRRGVFVPAKADWWGCSEKFCGYASICPAFKRPKLIQIQTPLGAQTEKKE